MTGLTNEQIQERIARGEVNVNDNPNTRTVKSIVLGNTLTFFNFLNFALMVLVLLVGSIKNSFFMGIIIINTIIGIVQELRTKKILDKLAILTESKTVVLREGKKWSIATDKLVLDDIIWLKSGDQIPADALVLEGTLEVNESLLTGESDNLIKESGAELFSGSFVTAGEAYCRIIHVGKDNYASKITNEAKEYKKHNSELRNSMNAILKIVSIVIVPLGGLLFYKQYFVMEETIRTSVVSTVAAVIGMIPEGLVLLTSIALTLGTLKLAQKKTLVQEMYCIETLARVDTLCLDKTGTLTEGSMRVERVEVYHSPSVELEQAEEIEEANEFETEEGILVIENAASESEAFRENVKEALSDEAAIESIERGMQMLMSVLKDRNATANALHEKFRAKSGVKAANVVPFSSDRKYSGASFENEGSYLIGAAQFLFPEDNEEIVGKCEEHAKEGFRVLVLAHSESVMMDTALPSDLKPLGLILLTDVIRKEAPDTLQFFYNQEVDLKVISGDDPVTVAYIAQKAGLKNAENYVDATTLVTDEEIEKAVREYNVFGRVTPQQKRKMVQSLKKQGHTVAMTGDGVNDVLALKEADCSIAMAEGSEAAKNIANVVLLDSDFSAMPQIVNQGRRVVNNIRTAASMFLIKTMFSAMLAVLTIFFGSAYPFEPIQMSLISACAVGIPTFLLAQENNFDKIDNTFLRHVFMNAFPAAITITGCVFSIMIACTGVYKSVAMLNTACFLVTGWNYMAALKTVYAPLNRFRKIVIYGMQIIFFVSAVVLQNLLTLKSLEFGMIIWVFLLMTFSPILIEIITGWIKRIYQKSLDQEEQGVFTMFVDKLRH
ncbi:MAG: cation-translocating P-type ATPase [Eubacteriales bacterium]|nr:cation-translocating P-type ATPase [Eubacteriales bacterium]